MSGYVMGMELPPLMPGNTLSRRDADWESGGHDVARGADAERVRCGGGGGHSGRTGQLLKHFGISKPMLSYFQFNEARRSEEILERLGRGEKVALVTDAGSPGISDPGERVVWGGASGGVGGVESVPGPCALVAALTASGLATDEFHFIGFLPHKSGQRRKQLESLKAFAGTLILYESPYRIEKLLASWRRFSRDARWCWRGS